MKPLIILLVVVVAPLAASAQTFPADSAYLPLGCDNVPMSDAFADEAGALVERDIVGNTLQPAGLRASDATHLFVRMRLDGDPAPGGTARPFSWGMEIDTNGDLTNYEILLLADGASTPGAVSVFRNTMTTLPNDPTDPADLPVVATYTFATNARSTTAAGTANGGNPDAFLSFAIPWTDLISLGLDRDTAAYVWVASSNTMNSLDGDFACHAPGTDGAPTLMGIASDPTTGDPTMDPDPVGGSGRLEGGAGCAAGGGAPLVLALLWLPMLRRRRPR